MLSSIGFRSKFKKGAVAIAHIAAALAAPPKLRSECAWMPLSAIDIVRTWRQR